MVWLVVVDAVEGRGEGRGDYSLLVGRVRDVMAEEVTILAAVQKHIHGIARYKP